MNLESCMCNAQASRTAASELPPAPGQPRGRSQGPGGSQLLVPPMRHCPPRSASLRVETSRPPDPSPVACLPQASCPCSPPHCRVQTLCCVCADHSICSVVTRGVLHHQEAAWNISQEPPRAVGKRHGSPGHPSQCGAGRRPLGRGGLFLG